MSSTTINTITEMLNYLINLTITTTTAIIIIMLTIIVIVKLITSLDDSIDLLEKRYHSSLITGFIRTVTITTPPKVIMIMITTDAAIVRIAITKAIID